MLSPEDITRLVLDVRQVFGDWEEKDVGMDASDILAAFAALTHSYSPLVDTPASEIFRHNMETALELEEMEETIEN